MGELLQENLVFHDGKGRKLCCRLYLLNFSRHKKVETVYGHAVPDLLHAVAGVCSVSLPDMEIPAIYSTLTSSSCSTAVIITSKEDVINQRAVHGHTKPRPLLKKVQTSLHSEDAKDEEENPFISIISDEEDAEVIEEEKDSSDPFNEERQSFLDGAALRRSLPDQLAFSSVGAEHCVLGCAAFSRLTGNSTSGTKPIQLSLLAVRHSCRKMGIGRHLMQIIKDPEVVGQYNALLTFADPKAEDFFTRHGFSEDPLLSAQYQPIVEHWENSSLMVYIPPFSESGLSVGTLKSLAHFQAYYKQWRESAIVGYSAQLGVMERLRHELLLLHSKVHAQDKLIEALSKELKEAKQANLQLEQEFQQYRKQSQRLMCDNAVHQANEWIKKT